MLSLLYHPLYRSMEQLQADANALLALRDPLNREHFWINPLSTHISQIKVSDLV
jgi:hypothetical protein